MLAFVLILFAVGIYGVISLFRYRRRGKASRGACGWAIAAGVLGAIAGFFGIVALFCALFVGSGADMGILFVLVPVGLFIGCPIGGAAGAWLVIGIASLMGGPSQAGPHVARAVQHRRTVPVQGSNQRAKGAGIGLIGGALAGLPLLLLVPQWYFERMGSTATVGVVVAGAVVGTVVGALLGGGYQKASAAGRKMRLLGGLACVAVLAVGAGLSLGSVGRHTATVKQMLARHDIDGLIMKLQTGGQGQTYSMSSVGTDVREKAAEALGQSGDKRAVPALMAVLSTTGGDKYGLRCTATRGLGQLGDRQAVPALIEALKRTGVNGEGPEVVTIIRALGKLRDPQAVPALLEHFHSFKDLTHTNVNEVPEEAGKALAQIGGPEIVPAVVAKLADPDTDMRCVAARTLGKLLEAGDPQAVPALMKALSNDDWGTRMYAAQALKAGGPAAMPALIGALTDPAGAVGGAAAEALAGSGPAAVPALIDALKSPAVAVRASAAKSLGAIGDERAKEPLRAAANDPEKWVRDEAGRALREHGW